MRSGLVSTRRLMFIGVVVTALAAGLASPANAAFTQLDADCSTGPNGTACSRLYFDQATFTWKAYGATDPSSGAALRIYYTHLLRSYSYSPGVVSTYVVAQRGESASYSYQSFYTSAVQWVGDACDYSWSSLVKHHTDGYAGDYYRKAIFYTNNVPCWT